LTQYLRESPDGRACLERHFKATPQGRALLEEHFRTTPEGRARLEHHLRAKPEGEADLRESIAEEIRRQQPTFLEALRGDTAVYASLMLKPLQFKTGVELLRETARLSWENDAFFRLLLYRVRVRLYVRGVPVLPTVLHRLCVMLGQIDVGNHVRIAANAVVLTDVPPGTTVAGAPAKVVRDRRSDPDVAPRPTVVD
jgi:hypothetical protein